MFGRKKVTNTLVNEAFSKYISKEKLREIFSGEKYSPSIVNNVDFILINVKYDSVTDIQKTVNTVSQSIRDMGGVIDIISSLIVASFGVCGRNSSGVYDINEVVAHLLSTFGNQIRIVHSTSKGAYGTFANEPTFNYGPLIPGLEKYIKKILDLAFGESAIV
jgi:hypothetical protein